jgi:hypothetical protein
VKAEFFRADAWTNKHDETNNFFHNFVNMRKKKRAFRCLENTSTLFWMEEIFV